MNEPQKPRKPIYPKVKVRLRFFCKTGKQITPEQWLKGILPALWDESDKEQATATALHYTGMYNTSRVFFFPYPLDFNRTRLLDMHASGCYQHFPWEQPKEEIHPLCETCGNWDFSRGEPVQPFWTQHSKAAFLCPVCGNVAIDDYAGGKAGTTCWLTRNQFLKDFGAEVPKTA